MATDIEISSGGVPAPIVSSAAQARIGSSAVLVTTSSLAEREGTFSGVEQGTTGCAPTMVSETE